MTTSTTRARSGSVNLYGLLKLEEATPPEPSSQFRRLVDDIAELQGAEATLKKVGAASSAAAAKSEMRDKATKLVLELRRTTWETRGLIGPELDFMGYDDSLAKVSARDAISRMSGTSMMLLSDLRKLVISLGFVVIPLEYLSALSGHRESDLAASIGRFKADADTLSMSVHVMTPTAYYGVQEHAESDDPNLPCFDGKNVEAMYLARQNAAVFRNLFGRVGTIEGQALELSRQLRETRTVVNRVIQDVQEHAYQIHDLKQTQRRYQERERAMLDEIGRQTAENRRLSRELAVMTARASSAVVDPMVFAMKRNVDLCTGDGRVYIGPCWGPDFDLAVATAHVQGAFDPCVQATDIRQRVKTLWG